MKKKANKNVNYDKIKGFLKIPSTSEPYLKAKYLMELHLGTFELETFNIWRVENQALRTLYEDYCEQDTVTKVNTVMLVQNLGELNSPLQISERGFLIPQSGGLLFPCGFLPSDLDSAKVYNAIICEIAVASPIEETAQNITPEFIAKVEKGTDYDSIKIKPKENEKAAIMKTHPFENNMILFSSDQIMPKFVVEFSYKQNTKGVSYNIFQLSNHPSYVECAKMKNLLFTATMTSQIFAQSVIPNIIQPPAKSPPSIKESISVR